jgi:acetylornithine deacetylase/succinyl-diaminopimelate desuccinylase-like protein
MSFRTVTLAGFLAATAHLGLPAKACAFQATDPTAALLVDLIRANTSNPPGNERRIADLLAPRFKALGFDVQIIPTPDSGKAHFIARLKGDGSKRPILLAAHADVVGVEREKWSVDPFAGEIKDDHVFGRGAVDFKGGMAVFARAVMMLAERHIPLARDVIFIAEADEEGGSYNTSWLAREHWADMDAEFALNEGGWIMKRDDGRVRYVSISTADKSSIALTVTARGTSTHSSMPRPDNAIFALSRAMAKLSMYETPLTITPATKQFFTTLARTSTPPMSDYYRDLVGADATRARRADSVISKDPLLHALVRNTLAPVIVQGGFRANVIPGSAQATINLRVVPGSDPEAFVAELRRVVGDPGIEMKLAANAAARPAAPSPEETDLYRALEREAKVEFPGAEVTPYLFQAGTDAGAWRSRGVPVYGIYPYPIDADELTRMHGNDEKVSVAALKQGTDMIYRTLISVAGKR